MVGRVQVRVDEASVPQLEGILAGAEQRAGDMRRELQCACEALRAPWFRADHTFEAQMPGGGPWRAPSDPPPTAPGPARPAPTPSRVVPLSPLEEGDWKGTEWGNSPVPSWVY